MQWLQLIHQALRLLLWSALAGSLTLAQAQSALAPVKAAAVPVKSGANNSTAAPKQSPARALDWPELLIASRVAVGRMPCELGVVINVSADAKAPGYFDVVGKKFKFKMTPVATSTGAVRLEDPVSGAVWLQLPGKSMLMNFKTGTRLADECMTPIQVAATDAMAKNPPPSLLAPAPVGPASRASEAVLP